MDVIERLKMPFPVDAISWRVGQTNKKKVQAGKSKQLKGKLLAYIDARDVQKRLDDVMDLDWQCRYSHISQYGVVCEIGLLLTGDWIWRADGAGENRDIEPTKSALSDAFKRAASKWGIGTYLYRLKYDNFEDWVDLDQWGNPPKGAHPPLPDWATPEGYLKLLEKKHEKA